ncbi:cation:proton antiporter [Alicyclobacillus sp.]|uniref:cation:proton antiporter n=1 Tax=Alicyclobacillus sp. TaxID=61169 RepID=UPI0025C47247|nr:cation:proton antiporter [Alicyclobacillus sp.]MCL6516681.1 cation:proton antiporter [Alicyclobacillus sp.]
MNGTVTLFLLVLVGSFIFSTLLAQIPRLRVPMAVSYTLFGILIQLHGGLNPAASGWINHLGDVGLLFLMFLSGLEVDPSLLQPRAWQGGRAHPLGIAAFIFCTTLLTSFALSWGVSRWADAPVHPWLLTLLFATTSLGVILPVLDEADLLGSEYGQVLLLCALLADLCTMLLVSLFVSARTTGSLRGVLIALVVIPAAWACFQLARWAQRVRRLRALAGDLQQRVRAALALVALFCAIADFTGAEPIIGSFVAGILVSALPFAFKRELADACHTLGYGFLIPVFFISVGLRFDPGILESDALWTWLPVLLTMAFVVKLVPAWHLRRWFGRRRAIAAGLLLSSRLSLVIAVAEIGVRIGALPAAVSQAIVLVAVVTCLVSPVLFLSML